MHIIIGIVSFMLFCTFSMAHAQGAFRFENYLSLYGIDAPIFDADGTPLYGTNYLAALYGGPTADSLQEAVNGNSGQTLRMPFTYTPNGNHGYFRAINTYALIEGVAPGSWVWLQVRAWDARLGNSYEDAMDRGVGGYGASELFREVAPPVVNPTPPTPLYGLQSFSLVPEPCVPTLFAVGLGIILLRRRRWKMA